tara:strand:- start:884 stop:1051 length:168 start_codon:yes stop_codon:yes gene_type:complete
MIHLFRIYPDGDVCHEDDWAWRDAGDQCYDDYAEVAVKEEDLEKFWAKQEQECWT